MINTYCTTADIQAEFKNIVFTETSNVTLCTVGAFIQEASALIDSKISSRYVTPIMADDSTLALLSFYCRTLVADRVRSIVETKQATSSDANQSAPTYKFGPKDVLAYLDAIAKGSVSLSGATLNNVNSSFVNNNSLNSVSPRFRRDVKQW